MSAIVNDQISNGSKLSIKLPAATEYVEIVGVENVKLPEQNLNGVEMPLLNAADGIKPRIVGSRTGGDLTFKINVVDGDDAGLLAVLTAFEGKLEVGFKYTYASGATRTIEKNYVLQCNPSEATTDAICSYSVSACCNSLMTTTAAPVAP